MTANGNNTHLTPEGNLVFTRVFDAPREMVWKAWTEPEHVKRWWGPDTYTSPTVKIDLRVGGKYLFAMRSPEGQDFWSTGTFREVVPVERLVMTDSFSNEKGEIVSPTVYGMSADITDEFLMTITFEDLGGKTRMTLVHSGMPEGEMREMSILGMNQSFDKMAESLKQPQR